MQYFYIVGYVTNGDDLKLCRVSLNQHEVMSWARREAIKHDERTYELHLTLDLRMNKYSN